MIMQKCKSKKRGLRFHEIRTLRYIQAFLGLVLIVAGTLKLYAFTFEYQEDDLATVLLAVLAEMETFGGLWLLWGNDPEQARPWVVAVFAGLWLSSLYQVLAGRCSCGCFGSMAVSPWFVLIFDTVALAVLLKWRSAEVEAATSFTLLGIIGLTLTVMGVGVAGIGQQSSVVVAGTANWRGHPLDDTPLVIKGNSLELRVQTDDEGYFALPPLRPGQYTMSMTKTDPASQPNPDPPDRGLARDKGAGRPQRKSQRGPAEIKGLKKWQRKPSELAREYADKQIVSLDLDECSPNNIIIEFK